MSENNIPKLESLSDQELLLRIRKGNRNLYRFLVERYEQRAFHIALQIVGKQEDAEDIVQESFVKAYLALNDFRGSSSFYTWLYRIVFNMAVDFKRRLKRRGGEPLEFDEQLDSDGGEELGAAWHGVIDSPQESLLRQERVARFSQAMQELSEEHRAVITLREVDGLSYEEIAEIVGVSKGTVMSRLHYARKKLQERLRDLVSYGNSGDDDTAMEVAESGLPEGLAQR